LEQIGPHLKLALQRINVEEVAFFHPRAKLNSHAKARYLMKVTFAGVVCWLLFAVTSFAGLPAPAIIPQPQQMQVNLGTFTLYLPQNVTGIPVHVTTKILVDSNSLPTAQYLAALLLRSTGCQFQIATNSGVSAVKGSILLTTVNAKGTLGAEGYELTVTPDSVVIRAPAQPGIFYGVQSLLQLLPPQVLSVRPVAGVAWVAPCVYIQDQPRFPWRGFMMDESRHFFGKQEVKKFMDAMALQKMNTFHWHLVDDEGWRIQILAYPLLTQVGAWRNGAGTTNSSVTAQNNGIDFGQNPRVSSATNGAGLYGGFYTQDDIREIVSYAQQRHITIVPEIELPAHCTAGLVAYPQYGCGNAASSYIMDVNSSHNINYGVCLYSLNTNTTIPFFKTILTEVMGLFPGQYIHLGGDEVIATGDKQWTTYSVDAAQIAGLGITGTTSQKIVAYQHWFSTNMSSFLHANGRTMIGWTEFEAGGTVPNAVVMDWETGTSSAAIATATSGQPVVMSPNVNCYLNYPMSTNNRAEYPLYEPYFNNTVSYLPVSLVYSFEPIPSGLPAQYNTNILGAECAEWAEYIPSTLNEEFKAFPRLCAMAEVTWTPAAQKNFANFMQRLSVHKQRLTAMGMNYDNTNGIAIGTWGPTVSSNILTFSYDITPYVSAAGDINLDFHYTSGAQAINIYSVNLLVNGVQVDSDNTGYIGYAGLSGANLPYFLLHLKSFQPGATYTVQANYAGYQGTNSSGTIYIVNWN
jgi:hexosaminidase